jgi:hypothetical protein
MKLYLIMEKKAISPLKNGIIYSLIERCKYKSYLLPICFDFLSGAGK